MTRETQLIHIGWHAKFYWFTVVEWHAKLYWFTWVTCEILLIHGGRMTRETLLIHVGKLINFRASRDYTRKFPRFARLPHQHWPFSNARETDYLLPAPLVDEIAPVWVCHHGLSLHIRLSDAQCDLEWKIVSKSDFRRKAVFLSSTLEESDALVLCDVNNLLPLLSDAEVSALLGHPVTTRWLITAGQGGPPGVSKKVHFRVPLLIPKINKLTREAAKFRIQKLSVCHTTEPFPQ